MTGLERFPIVALATLILAVTGLRNAAAQDLEPRAFANTPVGLNFLVAGYGYSEGGVSFEPSVPIDDGEIKIHATFLAYARAIEVLGRSAKVDVIVPYAWLDGSGNVQGESRRREVEGFGDPRFRFSLNLYGAPALTLEEFRHYQQDVVVGVSCQVIAPFGKYDRDRLINIGSNRWTVKPEFGVSKKWGRFILELTSGVSLYTDNDDFLGNRELERDPLYSVQAHAIYTVWRNVWAAVDFTYYGGGRTQIDGGEGSEIQQNTRVGATLALPLGRYNSIKLFGSTGTSARLGADFDTIGVAWQTRFGGGL